MVAPALSASCAGVETVHLHQQGVEGGLPLLGGAVAGAAPWRARPTESSSSRKTIPPSSWPWRTGRAPGRRPRRRTSRRSRCRRRSRRAPRPLRPRPGPGASCPCPGGPPAGSRGACGRRPLRSGPGREELDHLGELVDGLVAADHVGEAGGGHSVTSVLVVVKALAVPAPALHAAHGAPLGHEHEEAHDEGDGQEGHQQRAEEVGLGDGLGGEGHVRLFQTLDQLAAEEVGVGGGHELGAALQLEDDQPGVVVQNGPLDRLAVEGTLLDGLKHHGQVTLARPGPERRRW